MTFGPGGNSKLLLETDIRHAMANTQSAHQAAEYLHVSYTTLKKYARMYGLWDGLKYNRNVKGVLKRNYEARGHKLRKILGTEENPAGDFPNYDRWILKNRIISARLLEEKCSVCGFEERRSFDNQMPLKLCYKNDDSKDIRLANLELRCLNHAFLGTRVDNQQARLMRKLGGIQRDTDFLESHDLTLDEMRDMIGDIKESLDTVEFDEDEV